MFPVPNPTGLPIASPGVGKKVPSRMRGGGGVRL